MPEAATARLPKAEAGAQAVDPGSRLSELKVSGHLMTLEAGLFCVVNTLPGAPDDGSGLPGVRISAAPGPAGRPEAVSITTFRDDGWLGGAADAALVRVAAGPAQVLVTIYQSPAHGADAAPRLQVMRLGPDPVQATESASSDAELVAHVSRAGDVAARIGDWIGTRGSRKWIEGFGITPRSAPGREGMVPADIEYQAVLGRGWLSPWVQGGAFCGSRGMALPVLGLRVRLRGAAAEAFECSCSATFVDGTEIGPVAAGEACEADSLAPLEAFRILLSRRAAATAASDPATHVAPRGPRVLKSARPAR